MIQAQDTESSSHCLNTAAEQCRDGPHPPQWEPAWSGMFTHSFGRLLPLPHYGEQFRLPGLVSASALLPQWVDVVIQQHPQLAHVVVHHAVVEGQAEATLLGLVTEQ